MTDPAEDLTHTVTAFHEAARWTGVKSEDTAEWLAARRKMITASDMAAIMGEDPYKSVLEVYVEKRVAPEVEDELPIEDPRWLGQVVEQPILRAVAKRHGWRYRAGGALLVSRAHPELGCTLDAEVDRGDGEWIVNECKMTELAGHWNEEIGELPVWVLIQNQSQLCVTKAPMVDTFAWLGRRRKAEIEVFPSDELHAILIERAEWFMDLVHRHEPPRPDGSESAKRALHRLYGDGDGSTAPLPDDAREWTERYFEITKEVRRLEKQRAHIQNLIRSHIGPATYGVLEGEPVEGKTAWKYQRGEGVQSRLIPVKAPPQGLKALPPVKVPTLADTLEESLGHASKVVPIRRKRRKARR